MMQRGFPFFGGRQPDAFDPRLARRPIQRGLMPQRAAAPAAAPRVDVQRRAAPAPMPAAAPAAAPYAQAQNQALSLDRAALGTQAPQRALAPAPAQQIKPMPAPQALAIAPDRAAYAQAQAAPGAANTQRIAAQPAASAQNQALIGNALAAQQQTNRNDYARRAPEDEEGAPLGRFFG